MRVMSFNIRNNRAADGKNSWENRREYLAAVVHKYAPKVLGIQEAYKAQVDFLAARLAEYKLIGVGRNDGKEEGEYAALFYDRARLQSTAHGTFWLSETPETPGSKSWGARCTRIATWACFRKNDAGAADTAAATPGEIVVVNTHLDHQSAEAQVRGTALLKQRVAEYAAERPVVVMGDFNCTAEDEACRVAERSPLPLRNARRISRKLPTGPAWTYHGFSPPGETAIDHIFVSAGIEVDAFHSADDNDDGFYPSDHLPVIADLHY